MQPCGGRILLPVPEKPSQEDPLEATRPPIESHQMRGQGCLRSPRPTASTELGLAGSRLFASAKGSQEVQGCHAYCSGQPCRPLWFQGVPTTPGGPGVGSSPLVEGLPESVARPS